MVLASGKGSDREVGKWGMCSGSAASDDMSGKSPSVSGTVCPLRKFGEWTRCVFILLPSLILLFLQLNKLNFVAFFLPPFSL